MVDRDVRYELKSVKALRGTESRSVAKWEAQGWELISQDTAALHTTLNFRKVKPPLPIRQILIGGVLVTVLAILGVTSALGGAGNDEDAAVARATPSAPVTTAPEATVEPTLSATQPAAAATPPLAPSGQPVEAPDGPLTNTTVDALLDGLNAPSTSGIKVGDRFRITGELMRADLWSVGRTGDYLVLLKAQDGRQNLPVFVDRSLTTSWGDGTRVEMIVKDVERTINGETTDGWLLVKSVQTL